MEKHYYAVSSVDFNRSPHTCTLECTLWYVTDCLQKAYDKVYLLASNDYIPEEDCWATDISEIDDNVRRAMVNDYYDVLSSYKITEFGEDGEFIRTIQPKKEDYL